MQILKNELKDPNKYVYNCDCGYKVTGNEEIHIDTTSDYIICPKCSLSIFIYDKLIDKLTK